MKITFPNQRAKHEWIRKVTQTSIMAALELIQRTNPSKEIADRLQAMKATQRGTSDKMMRSDNIDHL